MNHKRFHEKGLRRHRDLAVPMSDEEPVGGGEDAWYQDLMERSSRRQKMRSRDEERGTWRQSDRAYLGDFEDFSSSI